MSFSSGTFYVYLECDRRQYVVAFPSRSHADKFWRIVQKLDNSSSGECRRFSSQFLAVSVLPNRLTSNGWDPRSCLVREIGVGQSIPIIPPDSRPDNINKGMFYIRSTIRPEFYWYFEVTTGQISASKARQSRFMIQRAISLSGRINAEEDILIGEDDVDLSVMVNEGQQQGHGVKIFIDQWNRLVATSNVHHRPFQFRFFEDGFLATYEEAGSPVLAAAGPSKGERWEFVA